ncbi:MAG: tetratricopeptide repeat protein, partial [bacterium]
TISRFINAKFINLKTDAEKGIGPELCKKYQIPASYPTVLFLNSEGAEIDRIVGLFRKEDYFKTIQDYAHGKNTFAALLSRLPHEKNNATLNFKIGKKYRERGSWKQATQYYEKALSYEKYAKDRAIWWDIGIAYFKLGEFRKAEKAISKAVELDPDNPYLKRFLSEIKTESGK